jgi:hypothetical protein
MRNLQRFAILLGFELLLFALVVSAQTTPLPAPVVQHFVISVNAGAYGDNKGTTTPLTIAGIAVQITPNFSGGYNHIWDPNDSTNPVYKLGVGNYTKQLAELCSFCRNHFVFDTTQILGTFHGGIGTVTYGGHSKVAGDLGGFLSIPLSNHTSYQLLGYQRLFGVGSPTLNRNQVTTGVFWTF